VSLLQVLDELLDTSAISAEQADGAKSKFAALHNALFAAMGREKSLLQDAKQLKRQLDVSRDTDMCALTAARHTTMFSHHRGQHNIIHRRMNGR
jgi:hypothetical protein